MNNKYNLFPQWEKCPCISNLIADNFFAIKTPLDERYNDYISDENRWNVPKVFDALKDYKIGLWINLTNSTDFYNKDIIEEKNVKYVEIACKAHGDYPSRKQTKNFIELCHNFLMEKTKKIVVHCNYGFNITGFLICAYILEKQGWIIEDALSEFARHRPPGIYNKTLLQELYERYADSHSYYGHTEKPVIPKLPLWCSEQEYADDLFSLKEMQDPRKSTRNKEIFMENVNGVSQPHPNDATCRAIKRRCDLIRGWSKFFGTRRDSMDVNNIKLLKGRPYYVSYQDDGKRYMMLIKEENQIFFIGRNKEIFQVNGVSFPKSKNLKKHLYNTLLDGEMVINKHGSKKSATYVIHDIVTFENEEVENLYPFSDRLDYIMNEIIIPREKAKQNGLIVESVEPFDIQLKEFWPLHDTYKFFDLQFTQKHCQEIYGLIFQAEEELYYYKFCPYSLKWRPAPSTTACFEAMRDRTDENNDYDEEALLLISDILEWKIYDLSMRNKCNFTAKDFDGKIVECIWDYSRKEWRIMRLRNDKSSADSNEIVRSIDMRTIRSVCENSLLDYIAELPTYNLRQPQEPQKNVIDEKEIENLSKELKNIQSTLTSLNSDLEKKDKEIESLKKSIRGLWYLVKKMKKTKV